MLEILGLILEGVAELFALIMSVAKNGEMIYKFIFVKTYRQERKVLWRNNTWAMLRDIGKMGIAFLFIGGLLALGVWAVVFIVTRG